MPGGVVGTTQAVAKRGKARHKAVWLKPSLAAGRNTAHTPGAAGTQGRRATPANPCRPGTGRMLARHNLRRVLHNSVIIAKEEKPSLFLRVEETSERTLCICFICLLMVGPSGQQWSSVLDMWSGDACFSGIPSGRHSVGSRGAESGVWRRGTLWVVEWLAGRACAWRSAGHLSRPGPPACAQPWHAHA